MTTIGRNVIETVLSGCALRDHYIKLRDHCIVHLCYNNDTDGVVHIDHVCVKIQIITTVLIIYTVSYRGVINGSLARSLAINNTIIQDSQCK
jgi:hypothetical protein